MCLAVVQESEHARHGELFHACEEVLAEPNDSETASQNIHNSLGNV